MHLDRASSVKNVLKTANFLLTRNTLSRNNNEIETLSRRRSSNIATNPLFMYLYTLILVLIDDAYWLFIYKSGEIGRAHV